MKKKMTTFKKSWSLVAFAWLAVVWPRSTLDAAAVSSIFNQTDGFEIQVSLTTWSNFGDAGGCVTCPYTCTRPLEGPEGVSLNFTNSTQLETIPSIYNQPKPNGCCFAAKTKSKIQPGCNQEASPPEAEDCGFLMGPSLNYSVITKTKPPEDPMRAILFASIDCENFWAVGETLVKQDPLKGTVKGMKPINGGCYGDPNGVAMVLSGCLTNTIKFDKSDSYTWKTLARKCMGLSGICTRTNSFWGKNLKCCTSSTSLLGSKWDLDGFELYNVSPPTGVKLSGLAVTGIVLGGVALMMFLVHCGAKVRERAKQTAMMREKEASDDYEEIVTPLVSDQQPAPLRRGKSNPVVEHTLDTEDIIYRPEEPELLYEGVLN